MIRSEPEKYINEDDDRGEEGNKEEEVTAEARENMSERERYESLCRAPWPLVSPYSLLLMVLQIFHIIV